MIEVSAAIIERNGKFLIAQRPANKSQGLKWEFPGGKAESGETAEESLVREIREELDIDIKVKALLGESIYEYPNGAIKLIGFYSEWVSGSLKLHEHKAVKWVTAKELKYYDFSPADMFFVKKLAENPGY